MANEKNKSGYIPSIIRDNPISASVLSKLTKDTLTKTLDPLQSNIPTIGLSTHNKIVNNEDIVRMFPDVELCIQILVSSVISPNDMTSSKLLYKAPDLKIPTELKNSIISLIEEHLDKHYNLNAKLSTILRESLFTKGSYIEAIVPEASLDDIISQYNYNGSVSMESYINARVQPTYNYLGSISSSNSINLSNESMSIFNIDINKPYYNNGKFTDIVITQEDLGISITDNPKVLSINNTILKAKEKQSKSKLYGTKLSTENDILNTFFREDTYYRQLDYIEVKLKEDASRDSIGRPLAMKLPVESVIPVHVVNDPTKHLGYFVMIDGNGTPISGDNLFLEDANNIINNVSNRQDQGMGLIKKASQALYGMIQNDEKLENLEELYSKLVENLILKKLSTGMYGDLVTIKDNADIYRVMLARALKNQQTKLLFLPKELVAFYAFEYRDNGTGKSLMEKASILYSVRAILLFSRVMASIKNSTTVTEVQATIDEDDPDPEKRSEDIISEVLKSRQNNLPLGVIRPDDLADWAHKLGLRFKFQHPSMANIDISTSDTNSSKIVPDDELERVIKEAIIMSYGLTPEIVESGYASDFATTVVAKNLLTAKRVTRIQEQFNVMCTEHIRKLASNDNELIEAIKELIESNKKEVRAYITKISKKKNSSEADIYKKVKQSEIIEFITNVFINEVEVYLPTPQVYEANSSKNAFDDFKTMVEEATDLLLSTDALPDEYVGNMSGKIDTIKAMFKSVLFRKWMLENNYLPEVGDFLTKDDDGKPVFDILNDHNEFIESLAESLLPFMKNRLKDKAKLDEKLQKIEDEANDTGSDDYGSDDSGDDTTDEGGDDVGDTGGDENMEEGDTSEESGDEGSDTEGSDDDMGDMGGDDDFGGGDFGGFDNEGGDEGEDGGSDQGGDDFGDMMGDEGGDDDTGTTEEPEPTEEEKEGQKLDNQLKIARIEKEKALAQKAIAEAKVASDKAGLEFKQDDSTTTQEGDSDDGTTTGEQKTESTEDGEQDENTREDIQGEVGTQQEVNEEQNEEEGKAVDTIGGDSYVINIPRTKNKIFQ